MRVGILGLVLGGLLATAAVGPALAAIATRAPHGGGPEVGAAAPLAAGEQADALALAYDPDGTLHLVARITMEGRSNGIVHRVRPPGGAWSAAEELTADFAIAGAGMELTRHPDGSLCLFFDGWRAATDPGTAGGYLTCLRLGTWEPPVQLDAQGVTATFDGAFAAGGTPLTVFARPTRLVGFGSHVLWTGDRDAGWPRLAIDGRGTLHATWAAFTDPFAVFTSRSTDGGTTWTEAESLTGSARADVPYDLVADARGDVHLLVPGSPSTYRRWSGTAWSAPVQLATDIGPKRLGVGPDGRVVVAWASQEAVHVLRQRPDGSFGEPEVVAAVATPPSLVAIAVDAAGAPAVAWADGSGLSIEAAGGGDEAFAASVPSPLDITLDPVILAESALLAGGVILLVPLPAQLFNNTIEAHYAEISAAAARWRRRFGRWLGARGEGLGDVWRRPVGIAGFFVLAAVISAFLDPTIGPNLETLATIGGLLVGLVTVAAGFAIPAALLHRIRNRGGARLEVLPLALPIAVVSVAISRLTSFEPGYLYGLLAGVTLLGQAREGDSARGTIVTSTWTLGLCLVAWVALIPVRAAGAGPDPGLGPVAAEAALATIVTSGLETLVFGLLPLDLGPGGALFRSNRRAWAVLLGVSVFAFFHVLVNPSSGYLADSAVVPVATTIGLFVLFAAVTGLTWAYFRFRRGPRAASTG